MIDSEHQLIVDKVTSRQRPSIDQVKRWASRQQIFVSSTMDDLASVRQEVATTISDFGAEPILFESFGARSDDSRQAYKSEVRRSALYLGILSRLYGTKLPSGYSATHEEYEEALKNRKEILLFLDAFVPDTERDGHLNRWIKELYQFHVLAKYHNVDEVTRLIRSSLERIASEELTPWVKLGHVIFQATKIERLKRGDKTTITLSTSSQDARVTSELENLLENRFGRSTLHFTYGRESLIVNVESIQEIVDPFGGNALILTCQVLENRHAAGSSLFLFGGSYQSPSGTYSHQDLVKIALRGLVLGENPPSDRMLQSLPRLDFQKLYQEYGDDHYVFPKILQLLIIEALSESGAIERVISFSIGRVKDGQMRVGVSVMMPIRYSNVEPNLLEIEGEIHLV